MPCVRLSISIAGNSSKMLSLIVLSCLVRSERTGSASAQAVDVVHGQVRRNLLRWPVEDAQRSPVRRKLPSTAPFVPVSRVRGTAIVKRRNERQEL